MFFFFIPAAFEIWTLSWKTTIVLVELGFVLAGDDQHPVMLLAGGE